jgi:CRP/FNR family transcriptional regulator
VKLDLRIETLKCCWVFQDLSENEIGEIVSGSEVRRYSRDQIIINEGDPPRFFYVVSSGIVKQFKRSASGKVFTTTIKCSGDELQVIAMFGAQAYLLSAQAITDTTALLVSKKDFLSFVTKYPVVKDRILLTMEMVINSAYERLSDFVGETATERVLRVLYMLHLRFGDAVLFNRKEIGDMAGTTVETTVRVLTKLKNEGIIESKRGGIVILDKTKLGDACQRSYFIPSRPREWFNFFR